MVFKDFLATTADYINSHQLISLAFMLEKERGYVDRPVFPPLWQMEHSRDSKTSR